MVASVLLTTPCGKAALLQYAVKGLHAIQGAGSAINAAEAEASGDVGGMLLNSAGAMFSFGRFRQACFAAGTPIRTPEGSKPIEQLQVGDLVLARDEHHPDS